MKLKSLYLLTIIAATISGCATLPIHEASDNIEKDSEVAGQKLRQARDFTPGKVNTTVHDGYYLSSKSFRMDAEDKLPDNFSQRYVVNDPNQLSLQEIISNFGRNFGVKTLVSADAIDYIKSLESDNQEETSSRNNSNNINSFEVIDPAGKGLVGSNVKFSIDFSGTGLDFLDFITAKTNLFWKWDDNKLTFFRTDTKTFKIDYLGGTNSFSANVSSSFQSQSGGQEEGSAGQSMNNNTHDTNMSYAPQNVWDSLTQELESLKSAEGKFAIAQEAGVVTVVDTPRNLRQIETYITELNKVISQQVAIRAEIYDVVIDNSAEFSTDWSAIYDKAGKYSMSMSTAFTDATNSLIGIGFSDEGSRFGGTQAFINSLNQVADVSQKTSATVHTTNGMAAPIQMLDTTGYLASVERQVSESGGNSSTSVEQGTAKSGFSLSFLPRVTSTGKINMMFAGDLTQLKGFNESTFDGTTIQMPDSQNKNFLQRVIVESGQTIMVAGFERTESAKSVDSLAGEYTYLLGGKKSGGTKKVMTVIMLTPYVK
tara:strand:+ start:1104 stop:2723 length:1620 start_codon:yes stop_codon:yes gene_type:complete